ncbi:MAG: dephospho-CoA kinase [Sinobacterium sp.]|nr:dephospho-CoA kinase [Sinobacterium sp.]
MFIVGITGGIGSGKTAVSDRFEDIGICVVDADLCSRVVVQKGRPALQQIAEHFGHSVLTKAGELDRANLRSKIFNDVTQRKWLESLLHPLIREELMRQLHEASSAYVILASPLLIESQQHLMCDEVIVVDVPVSTQIQRTIARDNNDEEQVRNIIAAQATREERIKHATQIITNTQGLDFLNTEVARLHSIFLQQANEKTLHEQE